LRRKELLVLIIFRKKIFVPLIIGVALVVSLIATPLWIGEYIASSQLKSNFECALVDIKVTIRVSNFNDFSDLENDIRVFDFIRDIKTVISRSEKSIILRANNITLYPAYNGTKSLLLAAFNASSWKGNITIKHGELPVNNNEIAITSDLAELFGVNIGDEIEILSPYGNFNKTYKVVGIFHVSELLEKVLYEYDLLASKVPVRIRNRTQYYWGICLFTTDELIGGWGLSSSYSGFPTYLIWIDKERIFNPWNPEQMYVDLKKIDSKIIYTITDYVPIVSVKYDNYLEIIVENYADWPSALKLQLTYAILPSFFVGGFLSVIIGWTYINRRKREIALFRIRGVNKKQLSLIIVFEFLVVSLFGSILGFLFSGTLTIISAYILFPYYAYRYSVIIVLLENMINYLIISILYGILFGFLSVIPASIQALKISIIEGLSPYLEKIEKEPRPIYSFFSVSVGMYSLLESYMGLYVLKNIALKFMVANSALIQVIGVLIFVMDIVAIGTGPFALAYGLSKIVAYYSSKMMTILESVAKFFAKSFSPIATKHFARRPARTARLIFVTALIMSFMLTAGINSATNVNEITNLVKVIVGDDYRVDLLSRPKSIDFWENTFLPDLMNITNEIDVTLAYYMYKPIRLGLPYALIIAVDPKYFDNSFITDDCLQGVTVVEAKNYFLNGTNAILGISAKTSYGFRIGDSISFRFSFKGESEIITFKVIGFVSFMPGLLTDIYAPQKDDHIIMLVNSENVKRYLQAPYRLLIHKDGDFSDDWFIGELKELFFKYSLYADIYCYREVLDFALRSSISGLMANIYKAEFTQLTIVTAFSIYIVLLTEYLERRREIALMLSRGASRKQVFSIAEAEAFLIIMTGLITSIIISWGFAYPLLEMVTYGLIGAHQPPPGHGIIISMDTLSALALEAIIVFISARLAMQSALKIDLPKEIRIYH